MPINFALLSFVCLFAGAMTGMIFQGFLPKHHLGPESKDIVKLGAALIATMAALVLGLLVSSAKSSFDSVNTGLIQSGAKFIVLDGALSHYGEGSAEARKELRQAIESVLVSHWPEEAPKSGPKLNKDEAHKGLDHMFDKVGELKPATETQRSFQARAAQICNDLEQARWLLLEEQQGVLPVPFLVVLLLWLTALNFIYGLFAPRNFTVIAVFAACALSVSGAIFLIFEMSRPMDGWIKASSAPLRKASEYIGR